MFEKYSDIFISEDYKYYKFTSVGVKGRITKIVRYYDLDLDDYYNLGFGDQDPVTGDLDDLVISNNGDSEKGPDNGCNNPFYIYQSLSQSESLHYWKYRSPYETISYEYIASPVFD